jgi:hypothetical protein
MHINAQNKNTNFVYFYIFTKQNDYVIMNTSNKRGD